MSRECEARHWITRHTSIHVMSNGNVRTAAPVSIPLKDCEHSCYIRVHCTYTHEKRVWVKARELRTYHRDVR